MMLLGSLSLHVVARAGLWVCIAGIWAGGAAGAAGGRLRAATPHPPSVNRYKYIPLSLNSENEDLKSLSEASSDDVEEQTSGPGLPPSELILTALRTALDVVRGINAKRQAARARPRPAPLNDTALTVPTQQAAKVSAEKKNGEEGRGFEDYYDEHDHYTTTTTTTPKPAKPRYTDPWAGYYDFIINEGSFKFWSVFQLFTAALLLYACLSAIYYAKFNPIIPDYDREYDDYFLERTVGRQARSLDVSQLASGLSWMNPRTFQFILDAISKNYET